MTTPALDWPWLIMAISAGALIVVARPLGTWAWSVHGRPYGFWTERGFRWTYCLLGLTVLILGAAVLVGTIQTNIEGAVFVCLGVEIALASRALGEAHWKRSGLAARTTYQTSWLAVGVGCAAIGLVVLALYAAEGRLAR
jgi:hypothetical protein